MTDGVYEKLSAPFPAEAYEVDDSRGFVLTGIKGAFVVERLNQVFGLCGSGWSYTFCVLENPPETREQVNVQVELTYHLPSSEVSHVPAIGSSGIVKGRYGDALKGAITDGIKKAASMIGVGIEAYKGEIGAPKAQTRKQPQTQEPFSLPDFVADEDKFKRAGAVVFEVGKHKEECIADVYDADKGYIAWLTEQPKPDADSAMLTAWAASRYYRAYQKAQE